MKMYAFMPDHTVQVMTKILCLDGVVSLISELTG